jgi:hypothetical protein
MGKVHQVVLWSFEKPRMAGSLTPYVVKDPRASADTRNDGISKGVMRLVGTSSVQ